MKTSDRQVKNSFKIILFYKYVAVDNPAELKKNQLDLCSKLDLKGRVIVSKEGINATLEGVGKNIEKYCHTLQKDSRFKDTHFKKSSGTGEAFPKLSVKVRKEIVSSYLDQDENIDPTKTTGKRVDPDTLHKWLSERDDIHVVDMRNDYEYEVGRFEGSIFSGMKNFRDLQKVTKKMEGLKNKTVVTVCTGGVRCEKASGYLVQKGFKDVYQLDGGIVSYMEKYPGQKFKGSLYVFDKRITMHFDTEKNHTVIGKCLKCSDSSENYINCANKRCNRHFICCLECLDKNGSGHCSTKCRVSPATNLFLSIHNKVRRKIPQFKRNLN